MLKLVRINVINNNNSNKCGIINGEVVRYLSLTFNKNNKSDYKVLIVGGGTGGISSASKFTRKLGAGNVAVIEPSKYHYYQPGWTLAGGGIKDAESFKREEAQLIPSGCDWIQTKVKKFDPENNCVYLENDSKINYKYLIVAVGIQTNFQGIKGLVEALDNDDKVVTNYSPIYVKKTFKAIQNFKEGNAIFTFPNSPIKCPGAPQKIMYLAEDYFRIHGIRDKATVIYNTALPVIFGVKKYAASLLKVVEERNIKLNTRTSLVEIDYKNNNAIFEKLDKPGTFETYKYSLLHVGPPMKPWDMIKQSPLADANGYVDVYPKTLQHKKYANIFGIGDCTNLPTSKTAAAVSVQSQITFVNLNRLMNGHEPIANYDGYTSCPLVTGYGKLILAEFDFDGNPLETFPFDQGKERKDMYYLKKDAMPALYWHGLLKGLWNGPGFYRKVLHLGQK